MSSCFVKITFHFEQKVVMKRRRTGLVNGDIAESTEPKTKKRKIQRDGDADNDGLGEDELPSLPPLQPLNLCSVHAMKLRYAASLDKTAYDKCQECQEPNEYESMHFLFECGRCGYFVCNFCMADLYSRNRTRRSPGVVAKKGTKTKKKSKSKQKTASKKSKKSTKKKTAKYQYHSELNGDGDGEEKEGSIASRIRNGRRNRKKNNDIQIDIDNERHRNGMVAIAQC